MTEKFTKMWDISKEQEERFIKSIPEIVEGIDVKELFKLIRSAEYKRGKEENQTPQIKKDVGTLSNPLSGDTNQRGDKDSINEKN